MKEILFKEQYESGGGSFPSPLIREFDPADWDRDSSGIPGSPTFVGPQQPSELTIIEQAAFQRFFPQYDLSNYGPGEVRNALLWYVNNLKGDQDVSDNIQMGAGLPGPDCGCGKPSNLEAKEMTVNHAATYIPDRFRMKHKRIGSGRHDALLGTRTVLEFANKKSCAAFCRSWNHMMSQVGCANSFLPGDVIQVFSDVIIGGSGHYGLKNEFSPPFRGRVNA